MRIRIALLFVLITSLPALTMAATPAETFQVGTLHVTRYGNHGRPLILIPGLASGAWAWKDTIKHFQKNHVIYTVTLAGFDGLPPPKDHTHLIQQAAVSLLELIQSQHIKHPVLIGHSLGGTLSLEFATKHSALLGGVIAVDGLPVFPGTQNMNTEQRTAAAAKFTAQMAHMPPEQYKAQQLGYMQHVGVIDPAMAAKYAVLTAKSDPAAVAEYAGEDFALDLRPSLKKIGVPVMEISPYNPPDFDKHSRLPISEAQKTGYYQMLLAGTPHVRVVSISPARHFVMLDQPAKFRAVVAGFIGNMDKGK